jgi:hypothetical protein
MLAGRNDVDFPARYAKQIATYSDDGEILYGAYGYRWRSHFGVDQLVHIAENLRKNPEDRRCVLAMWDARIDLTRQNGKDLPCNTIATLSRNANGALDLTVFQRSGDIIWGVLGANCVHMSLMQEYVALMIGCPVGSYHQIVNNFHAYVDVFYTLHSIRPDRVNYIDNPYADGRVVASRMDCSSREADEYIEQVLHNADYEFDRRPHGANLFFNTTDALLRAHQAWRLGANGDRYLIPLDILSQFDQKSDWIVAGTDWIQRRYDRWKQRFILTGDENSLL